MKRYVFFAIGIAVFFLLGGCVEKSQKYKDLQARLDTLNVSYNQQTQEMEELFAGLNEISAGMQSLREAENLLALQTTDERPNKSKQQIQTLKNDIRAISEAIGSYKEQIGKLEGKNKRQSAEFKKLIEGMRAELEERSAKIAEITTQLAQKDKQLAVKETQIETLSQNVDSLYEESSKQKEVISQQDESLHVANYLLGTRKELKEAHVISRQGIFCPPIVSSQAQEADFETIDMRQVKFIPLHSKKAKVLSVHPQDSYILESGEDGLLTLKIKDENSFWKQTRYLVVMTNA